jgi:hypothetical protein
MGRLAKLYKCPECKLHYKDKETAIHCRAWCSKYKSCNLEITKLSEEVKEQNARK